jgi:hypothetical protein
MSKPSRKRTLALCLAMVLVPFSAATSVAATTQRPIQQFVAAQTSQLFWFDPETGNSIFTDYSGRNDSLFQLGLGTTTDGTITERALPDGRARVHVVLHTRNAFTTGGFNFSSTGIFGHTIGQVLAGADAALGDSLLTVDFINTAPGAAMPNLISLIFNPQPGQVVEKLLFVVNADGTLRAAFGVPDGTPGSAHTTQRGLFTVPGEGIPADRFPSERVEFRVTGQ